MDFTIKEADINSGQGESLSLISRTMDVSKAKNILAPYLSKVVDLSKELEGITVTDDATLRRCVEIGVSSHSLLKAIEKRRDVILETPATFVKNVKNLTRDFEVLLKNTKDQSAQKIKRYNSFLEQQRREEEARLQKEQTKMQEALKKDAETRGVEMVELPPVYVPQAQTSTYTDVGSQHTREHWTFRVINLGMIPKEYLMVDEKKVRAGIKQGWRGTQIPGIEIYRDDSIAFRE